jgi:AraC-like DNA-binding protein
MRQTVDPGRWTGLERSCARDWVRSSAPVDGVQRLRAWFSGRAFETHRHDTYAIGVTERGVQDFDYRGAARRALPGDVVVLHPDEPHDGRAGGPDGFGYRIIYIEPARVAEAARAIRGRPGPLPFVREVVTRNRALAAAVSSAFRDDGDADAAVVRLTERLLDASGAGGAVRLDDVAVARARELLDAETARVVGSAELEAVSGLTRYELARQFRAALGTSPYRYSVMRRIDRARRELHTGSTLADVAATTGFADQAHFTRVFKARLGVTPARYRALINSPSRARS